MLGTTLGLLGFITILHYELLNSLAQEEMPTEDKKVNGSTFK